MTMKITYAIGGLSIIAIIVSVAYNPIPEYDFNEITQEEMIRNENIIISSFVNSESWDWIKNKVNDAEETKDIRALDEKSSDKIKSLDDKIKSLDDKLSSRIDALNHKVTQLTNQQVKTTTENKNEISSFYTADNDGDKEDRFDKGEIVYFYLNVDSYEDYLYYEIVNDDTNEEIKDRRISINNNSHVVWAWSIPNNQTSGDYYIEIDVGKSTKRVYFDIR